MSKATIDLNSDMGEGFGSWKIGDDVDDAIMPLISSANIATGFHAGDPNIMNLSLIHILVGLLWVVALLSDGLTAIGARLPVPMV